MTFWEGQNYKDGKQINGCQEGTAYHKGAM